MIIKVCGMREAENIASIALLKPDFMGFIFYSFSSRDVSTSLLKEIVDKVPKDIKKVAVFVNENLENVLSIIKEYGFSCVQLHGNESVEYCKSIKETGISVIKVFSIQTSLDFDLIEKYDDVADYYLFDTKSPKHGGTGQKFDWTLLENYRSQKPVLLSGGINSEDVQQVKDIVEKFPFIKGLDLNSKFEISPAIKDSDKLESFIRAVRD